jgi:hypothetical protein
MEKNQQYWIEKFEAFLRENNCYEEFIDNVLNLNYGAWKTINEYYNELSLELVFILVSGGFPFCATKKRDFWSELDDKWTAICESEQIDNKDK